MELPIQENNESNIMVEQKESIKLTRGQRGGYGWEIKLLEINLARLKEINDELVKEYANKS
jgi:hypothetical protein